MKELVTIRIYFEYGKKLKDVSFWKKMHASDFASELLKRAKALHLYQAIHFNVTKGYLNQEAIKWGLSDIKPARHPQVIEITDTAEHIEQFLKQEKELLEDSSILIVKTACLLKP